MSRLDLAAGDGQSRADNASHAQDFESDACGDDIHDAVDSADLMKNDGLWIDSMNTALGPGQTLKNSYRMVHHHLAQLSSAVLEECSNIGPASVGVTGEGGLGMGVGMGVGMRVPLWFHTGGLDLEVYRSEGAALNGLGLDPVAVQSQALEAFFDRLQIHS
jgi:hypothetical protein